MVRKSITISGTEGEKVYINIYIGGEEIATIRGKTYTKSGNLLFLTSGAGTLQTINSKGFKILDIHRAE